MSILIEDTMPIYKSAGMEADDDETAGEVEILNAAEPFMNADQSLDVDEAEVYDLLEAPSEDASADAGRSSPALLLEEEGEEVINANEDNATINDEIVNVETVNEEDAEPTVETTVSAEFMLSAPSSDLLSRIAGYEEPGERKTDVEAAQPQAEQQTDQAPVEGEVNEEKVNDDSEGQKSGEGAELVVKRENIEAARDTEQKAVYVANERAEIAMNTESIGTANEDITCAVAVDTELIGNEDISCVNPDMAKKEDTSEGTVLVEQIEETIVGTTHSSSSEKATFNALPEAATAYNPPFKSPNEDQVSAEAPIDARNKASPNIAPAQDPNTPHETTPTSPERAHTPDTPTFLRTAPSSVLLQKILSFDETPTTDTMHMLAAGGTLYESSDGAEESKVEVVDGEGNEILRPNEQSVPLRLQPAVQPLGIDRMQPQTQPAMKGAPTNAMKTPTIVDNIPGLSGVSSGEESVASSTYTAEITRLVHQQRRYSRRRRGRGQKNGLMLASHSSSPKDDKHKGVVTLYAHQSLGGQHMTLPNGHHANRSSPVTVGSPSQNRSGATSSVYSHYDSSVQFPRDESKVIRGMSRLNDRPDVQSCDSSSQFLTESVAGDGETTPLYAHNSLGGQHMALPHGHHANRSGLVSVGSPGQFPRDGALPGNRPGATSSVYSHYDSSVQFPRDDSRVIRGMSQLNNRPDVHSCDSSSQFLTESVAGDGETTPLYAHHSLAVSRTKSRLDSDRHIEPSDSSSQYITDRSVMEGETTPLYAHQSLEPNQRNIDQSEGSRKARYCRDDAESTASSLPHRHYPVLSEQRQPNEVWKKSNAMVGDVKERAINHAHLISTPSNAYSTPCTTTSFEDIPAAVPVRSTTHGSTGSSSQERESGTVETAGGSENLKPSHHGYNRQASGSSFVSANSLGSNSLEGRNSLTENNLSVSSYSAKSTKSTAQSRLELSAKSLADALNAPDEETESYYGGEDAASRSGINPLSPGGYSADQSTFTLAARPIDESSDSGSVSAALADSLSNMMELRKALPMGESEDDDSHIERYGFGHAHDVEMSLREESIHRPHLGPVKPILPQSFPSLLDSSMSSSYSVSAPPSATPSFDNNNVDIQREGSREEREDTLLYNHSIAPHVGYIEEPLSIEVPLPSPLALTKEGSTRYIVDLEQIVEESSGHEAGDLSASSPGSHSAPKNPGSPAAYAKNVDSDAATEQWGTAQPIVREGHPTPLTQTEHQLHNNHNQFFNYRHQYYTEQYHYFDGDKYPSKEGGDDDTDSTCSSVTLSQAFQRSVHDDDSYASSSFMTEGSSHPSPTLSTVSSVTLSHALSVDRHEHSDQGFYVAVRLGDYVEGQTDDEIEVESVSERDTNSCVDVEERDANGMELKQKADFKSDTSSGQSEENSNDASEVSSPGAADDVLSDAPAIATKEIADSNERIETDILNMLIPECGVPIPSVMSKMGKQKSKGGMLLPWHSTRSIQNYQYGGGRKKKKGSMSSNSSLFSISSVHTFRG